MSVMPDNRKEHKLYCFSTTGTEPSPYMRRSIPQVKLAGENVIVTVLSGFSPLTSTAEPDSVYLPPSVKPKVFQELVKVLRKVPAALVMTGKESVMIREVPDALAAVRAIRVGPDRS